MFAEYKKATIRPNPLENTKLFHNTRTTTKYQTNKRDLEICLAISPENKIIEYFLLGILNSNQIVLCDPLALLKEQHCKMILSAIVGLV